VGAVRCEVRVDGEPMAATEVVREGDAPAVLRVGPLGGARRVELLTLDAGDYDAADRTGWVDGVFLLGPE